MSVPDHKTIDRDGYQITFHPAFASRCVVQRAGETEVELYRQEEVHGLLAGQPHPGRHTVRLRGGAHGRNVALTVEDPDHQIARIVVELYAPGHQPGGGRQDATVETMTVENDARTCPPMCE